MNIVMPRLQCSTEPADSPSTRLWRLAVGASMLFALFSHAALGQCLRAQILATPSGTERVSETERWYSMTAAEAVADDLELMVEGAPGPVIVELLDHRFEIVASHQLWLGDEPTRALLPSALAGIPEAGFQYYLRLLTADSFDPPLEIPLLEIPLLEIPLREIPLRVGLDCPSEGPCRWQVQLDVEANRPVAEAGLVTALDELEGVGQRDPFGAILSERPEWRGALFSLMLQMAGDAIVTGPGAGGNSSCLCDWIVVQSGSGGQTSGGLAGQPPLHISESWADGFGGWTAQMTSGQHVQPIKRKQSSAGLRLACYRFDSPRSWQIMLDSGRSVAVPVPVVQPCEAPCTAAISHSGSTALCAETKAFGRPQHPVSASAWMAGAVEVDGTVLASDVVKAEVTTTSPTGDLRQVTAWPLVSTTVYANTSTSTIFVEGAADLSIGPQIYPSPYLYTAVSASPVIKLRGEATCAQTSTALLQFGGNQNGGGTMTVRWGDPP